MEILQKVTELKAELDAYRPLDSDQEAAIMQKLRLDWNFHSNHLEGNSLSYGETKALILFGITAAGKPLKDHFEITGHDEAIKWVEEVVKEERPLTESFIRQIHKLILKEPYEVWGKTTEGKPQSKKVKIGEYKTTPNHVETITGEIFRFATPEETPAKMTDLLDWYRDKKEDPETHPLLLAAEFHYKFIRIHPFDDGNGRTARILMNFILMQYAYPPVIVKTEDKQNYFAALRQADAGSITPFIEYIGNNLEQSLDLMIRGAKGEYIDEEDDVDKEIALIEQKLKNNFGNVLLKKSKARVEHVFKNSIRNLLEKYLNECSKFKTFYSECKAYFFINYDFDHNTLRDKSSILAYNVDEVEKYLNNDIIRICASIDFETFKRTGIIEFKHHSNLIIKFSDYDFKIQLDSDGKGKWSKIYPYSELLTEDEINLIVRAETKAHTDFINQQIEKAKPQIDNNRNADDTDNTGVQG
jgi:Fic family protein